MQRWDRKNGEGQKSARVKGKNQNEKEGEEKRIHNWRKKKNKLRG